MNAVVEAVDTFADLVRLTQAELAPLVGPANAKKLFEFFHADVDPTVPSRKPNYAARPPKRPRTEE